jgi:hypothetical protein
MAIYRLLQQSAFDPEDITRMTAAYEECLRVLRLVNRADPITEFLAKHIIEVAQTGERDSSRISALTLGPLTFAHWPVPKQVNSSKAAADDPTLIEQVALKAA